MIQKAMDLCLVKIYLIHYLNQLIHGHQMQKNNNIQDFLNFQNKGFKDNNKKVIIKFKNLEFEKLYYEIFDS